MTNPYKFLRAATPYVKALRGKIFVVKLGGELLANPDVRLHIYDQLALLHNLGIQLVVVHGGGPQISAACERLGLSVETVNGRRVTDASVLEAVTMVLPGALQSRMLAELQSAGLPAVGLSGLDAGLIDARRRPATVMNGESVDFGEVGDISQIRPVLLEQLIGNGFLPVIAPLGGNDGGEVLNINADTVAAALAGALNAEKLVYLLDVRGILADPADSSSLIEQLDLKQLAALAEDGTLTGGMLPKAAAAHRAIVGGVRSVHLVSGTQPDALLQEIFTNEGSGTMVVEHA